MYRQRQIEHRLKMIEDNERLRAKVDNLIDLQNKTIEKINQIAMTDEDIKFCSNEFEGNQEDVVIIECEEDNKISLVAVYIDTNSSSGEISVALNDKNVIKSYISNQKKGVNVDIAGLIGQKLTFSSTVGNRKSFIMVSYREVVS